MIALGGAVRQPLTSSRDSSSLIRAGVCSSIVCTSESSDDSDSRDAPRPPAINHQQPTNNKQQQTRINKQSNDQNDSRQQQRSKTYVLRPSQRHRMEGRWLRLCSMFSDERTNEHECTNESDTIHDTQDTYTVLCSTHSIQLLTEKINAIGVYIHTATGKQFV